MFTINTIAEIMDAALPATISETPIEHISIDSRSLQNGRATLFFALSGPNNDGHQYIGELIEKGVRNFVVSDVQPQMDGINFLKVDNTTTALQRFAAHYRSQFTFPVIGITGSNGKTIVKEWLNFLLSPDYNVIRSPKSYNSQVGVPLSVLSINENHNFGIFEAGISTVNEMENLEPMIRPTIGILTNIGSAHDQGFAHIGDKIKDKLKLFRNSEVLILNKNRTVEAFLDPLAHTFSWSFRDDSADVLIARKPFVDKTMLTVKYKRATAEIKIPFQDDASVENAIHCLMAMLYLGYSYEIIEHRMALLFPVEMRLTVKNGINNTTIIDDSYSSDFQSLKIALDFLESQKQHKRKTLILSDIFQSGLSNDELYSRVSQMIIANKITRIIVIGETIAEFKSKFINCTAFKSVNEFFAAFDQLQFSNETILVKGARHFKFEDIVSLLEEKTHETVLEINLNAISHNLNVFRAKLNPATKLMVMVKAFGYGSGSFEIAKLLEHYNVDYLGVAFADEGISLVNAGIKLPIMVLNPENSSFRAIVQYKLEPEIYSLKGLHAFIKTIGHNNSEKYPIHIKLDTGMHRLGFDESHLDALITILRNTKNLEVRSIFSHLATSDDLEYRDFTLTQINRFEKMSATLMAELSNVPLRHILNTSGIANFPEAQYDMVRLGIGLYGGPNTPENHALQHVGTLKSVISQVRAIPAGDSVGYGRKFIAQKDTTIATIPIGYADGISRHWGNGVGFVTIKNRQAPIVGSICMDMLMVDVTEIDCSEGDSVIIFGESPTIGYMAEKLGTIPYEIMTGISQRVKRIFYRE